MQPPSFFLWKFLPNKLLPFLSRFFTAYISNYFCINVRTQPSSTHSAVSAVDVRRACDISFLSTSSSTIKEKSHLSQSPEYPQAQSFNSSLSHSQIFPFAKLIQGNSSITLCQKFIASYHTTRRLFPPIPVNFTLSRWVRACFPLQKVQSQSSSYRF